MRQFVLALLLLGSSVASGWAQSQESIQSSLNAFKTYYEEQFGSTQRCLKKELHETKVCSIVLRNEGNAPYILHHNRVTPHVAILFHGLSDSPFFLRSIAEALHQNGLNVVVALLPGHGLIDADADMQDPQLLDRWKSTVSDLIQLSGNMGENSIVGGFSAGATLATHFALNYPQQVSALLMFSGALALSDNAEQMTRIWGMQTIAKWIDGNYATHGRNPYKYPDVSLFAVYELMELIREVRSLYQQNATDIPTFAVHSAVDVSAPFSGIEDFLANNRADNVQLMIDESYALCHGHVPLNQQQVNLIDFRTPTDQIVDSCLAPVANPLHGHMIAMLINFIQQLAPQQLQQ